MALKFRQLAIATMFLTLLFVDAMVMDDSAEQTHERRRRQEEEDLSAVENGGSSNHYLAGITDYYHLMGRPRLALVLFDFILSPCHIIRAYFVIY